MKKTLLQILAMLVVPVVLLASGCSERIGIKTESAQEVVSSAAQINPEPAFLQRGCAESTIDRLDCPH